MSEYAIGAEVERRLDAQARKRLRAEIEPLERIVRDLAATDPTADYAGRCHSCGEGQEFRGPNPMRVGDHDIDCPWARAREWVKENPA